MYETNQDLPFVCQLNLPEAAQKVYREAFNRAWSRAGEDRSRYRMAQDHAWTEVRKRFEREKESGRWVPKAAQLEPRLSEQASQKRAAQ
jgi:cation transport regulator ChaB